jgi:hypothetical protein
MDQPGSIWCTSAPDWGKFLVHQCTIFLTNWCTGAHTYCFSLSFYSLLRRSKSIGRPQLETNRDRDDGNDFLRKLTFPEEDRHLSSQQRLGKVASVGSSHRT